MIRVLQIIGGLERAGAETFLVNLYRNIDKEKIQFDFAIYDSPSENSYYQEVQRMGAHVYLLPPKSNGIIKNIISIKKLVKRNGYNIVWRHTASNVGAIDLFGAKLGGCKNMILHSHCAEMFGIEKYISIFLRPIVGMLNIERFACGELAGKWLFGKKRFEIIHNGIDIEKFRFNQITREEYRNKLGLKNDEVLIGHIGRFEEQKNHSFLIKAFSDLHSTCDSARLILLGDGSRMEEIRNLVRNLGLSENVHFLGNTGDVAEWLQAMDVLWLPSYFEGFPVSLIEAQAAGLRCLVSDVVSPETAITSTVSFLPICGGSEAWINGSLQTVNDKMVVEKRIDSADAVERKGYSSRLIAERMNRRLLNLSK